VNLAIELIILIEIKYIEVANPVFNFKYIEVANPVFNFI